MSSILISDGLSLVMEKGDPGHLEALRNVVEFFAAQGLRAEMIDPAAIRERLQADPPDVLVTDLLPFPAGEAAIGELVGQGAERKTRLIVITSVVAEAGATLAISRRLHHLVDGYVIRPYCFRMSPEERRRFRVHLSFQEQLIATLGLILSQQGLLPPNDTGSQPPR